MAVTTVGLEPDIDTTQGLPVGESPIETAVTSTAAGIDTLTQPTAYEDPGSPTLVTLTVTFVQGADTVAGDLLTVHTGVAAEATCNAPDSTRSATAIASTAGLRTPGRLVMRPPLEASRGRRNS